MWNGTIKEFYEQWYSTHSGCESLPNFIKSPSTVVATMDKIKDRDNLNNDAIFEVIDAGHDKCFVMVND